MGMCRCVSKTMKPPNVTLDTKEGYGLLAAKTKGLGICLFRVKPKLHLQEHFPFPGFRFRNYFCYFFRTPPIFLGRLTMSESETSKPKERMGIADCRWSAVCNQFFGLGLLVR